MSHILLNNINDGSGKSNIPSDGSGKSNISSDGIDTGNVGNGINNTLSLCNKSLTEEELAYIINNPSLNDKQRIKLIEKNNDFIKPLINNELIGLVDKYDTFVFSDPFLYHIFGTTVSKLREDGKINTILCKGWIEGNNFFISKTKFNSIKLRRTMRPNGDDYNSYEYSDHSLVDIGKCLHIIDPNKKLDGYNQEQNDKFVLKDYGEIDEKILKDVQGILAIFVAFSINDIINIVDILGGNIATKVEVLKQHLNYIDNKAIPSSEDMNKNIKESGNRIKGFISVIDDTFIKEKYATGLDTNEETNEIKTLLKKFFDNNITKFFINYDFNKNFSFNNNEIILFRNILNEGIELITKYKNNNRLSFNLETFSTINGWFNGYMEDLQLLKDIKNSKFYNIFKNIDIKTQEKVLNYIINNSEYHVFWAAKMEALLRIDTYNPGFGKNLFNEYIKCFIEDMKKGKNNPNFIYFLKKLFSRSDENIRNHVFMKYIREKFSEELKDID